MRLRFCFFVIVWTLAAHIASPLMAVAAPPAAISPVKAEVERLNAMIGKSQQEMAAMDSRLESTTRQILHTYQRLDSEEKSLRAQRRAFNARIQEVYKNYDELLLGTFLYVRNFNDLWKNISFLVRVNSADRDLLAANEARLETIEKLKRELRDKKQGEIELRRRKQTEFMSLKQALLEKEALLAAQLRAAGNPPTSPVAPQP